MRRSHLGTLFIAAGLALMLTGLGAWFGPVGARAQTQPPPRPTLTPAPPTAIPHHTDKSDSTPVPTGRITGTVIDLTTGAPAPGIAVKVGEVTVQTDANGNYDRAGLAPGSYPVALELAAGQGVADQGAITVELAAGATVVQHLAFRSPVPVTPTAPTASAPPAQLGVTGDATSGGWESLSFVLGLAMLAFGAGLRRRGALRD